MFAAFDAVIRVDACCARVVLPGTGHVKMSELPDDDEALCFVIGPSLGLLLDSVVLTITPYKFHMWWQGDETPSKKVSFVVCRSSQQTSTSHLDCQALVYNIHLLLAIGLSFRSIQAQVTSYLDSEERPHHAMASDRLELEHDFLDNAKSFNWAAVKDLLKETPDLINVQPSMRWTALHQAAFDGNADIAAFLLEKGADPQALTRSGQTASEVAKNEAVRRVLQKAEGDGEGEAAAEAGPPKKKAKKMRNYQLNINNAVDKEYEGSSLSDIAAAPTSALQGVAQKGRDVLKKFKVHTISDLGNWKFYRISKAILGLSSLEQEGKREEGAALNINKALDKKHECKHLKEILELPPSALQGLAGWADAELAKVGVTTIAKLGDWKYAKWAEWISELSEFENLDFASL